MAWRAGGGQAFLAALLQDKAVSERIQLAEFLTVAYVHQPVPRSLRSGVGSIMRRLILSFFLYSLLTLVLAGKIVIIQGLAEISLD